MGTKKKVKKSNLIKEINWYADQINNILNKKLSKQYFEGLALTYTFIENLLKWLVFTQIIWRKSQNEQTLSPEIVDLLRE